MTAFFEMKSISGARFNTLAPIPREQDFRVKPVCCGSDRNGLNSDGSSMTQSLLGRLRRAVLRDLYCRGRKDGLGGRLS
jgi:hypothetical protein